MLSLPPPHKPSVYLKRVFPSPFHFKGQ
uniref:Uncharacterized protein n=1 Tax=Anguilla anguilla TaxID=7936 RepID=A0A0E9R599_ANGAN